MDKTSRKDHQQTSANKWSAPGGQRGRATSTWRGDGRLRARRRECGEQRSAAIRAEPRPGGGGRGSAPFLGWCAGCAVGVGGEQGWGAGREGAGSCGVPHTATTIRASLFAVASFATTALIKKLAPWLSHQH
jgi:hypothetical protein